jgi:hypothetical protein
MSVLEFGSNQVAMLVDSPLVVSSTASSVGQTLFFLLGVACH